MYATNRREGLLIFNYKDENAVIYNPDGSEYVKFYAGEGIQDCQVDVNEDIWVSYCDEGILESAQLEQMV